MQLVIITICIQREHDLYSAYSPNLLGVGVTADTREDVERQMLDRIMGYIESLRERHDAVNRPAVVVAKGPLEEKIQCLFIRKPEDPSEPGSEPQQCELKAKKEGLCFLHWRQLYGHAVDQYRTTRCEVCGETDSNVLRYWDTVCPGKAADPNWRDKIEERKARELELKNQEKLLKKIKKAEEYKNSYPPPPIKPLPPKSPHDPIGKRDFISGAGISYAELGKLLRRGEVEGIMLGGRIDLLRDKAI